MGWVGKGHSHPEWQLWEGTSHPLAAAGKKIYQLVRVKDLQKTQVFGPSSAVQVFTESKQTQMLHDHRQPVTWICGEEPKCSLLAALAVSGMFVDVGLWP